MLQGVGFMGKKEQKQFQLIDNKSCIIYLLRIITTAEKCIIKLKRYNTQHKEILDEYVNKTPNYIPYDIYSDFLDKTAHVINYLLNILGDAQGVSISYFKYRQQAQKLINQGVNGIQLIAFSNELSELIADFNRMRNWSNHIPESLLISELELVKAGKAIQLPENPIEIYLHECVTYEYFKDLYANNCAFYQAARKLVQACKRDYSSLIGDSVTIIRKYLDTPIDLPQAEAAKMSAKVQGIKGNVEIN